MLQRWEDVTGSRQVMRVHYGMSYVFSKPSSPSFTQKGLRGFHFRTGNKNVEVYFVDVEKGHDTFLVSREITHTYYILDGEGFFTIDGKRCDVKPGVLVEVPPNVEYTYSGTMRVLLIMNPPWFAGNDQTTKKNPAV